MLMQQYCFEGMHCAVHCPQCAIIKSKQTQSKVGSAYTEIHYQCTDWKQTLEANVVAMSLSLYP